MPRPNSASAREGKHSSASAFALPAERPCVVDVYVSRIELLIVIARSRDERVGLGDSEQDGTLGSEGRLSRPCQPTRRKRQSALVEGFSLHDGVHVTQNAACQLTFPGRSG